MDKAITPALGIGEVNADLLNLAVKEAMRRAIIAIRQARADRGVQEKVGLSGELDDIFTRGDTEAQEIYIKLLRECFPNVGIIAEENKLRVESAPGVNAHFTIDPLDGTKAYEREQQHGIASMLGFVLNDVIEAAYVGNVTSGDFIYYRPNSDHVWRVNAFDSVRGRLTEPTERPKTVYALLRDPIHVYESEQARRYIERNPAYKIEGSSIGAWASRLWTREVDALLLPPGKETPWDSTPVIGITEKLGYVFMKPDAQREWQPYRPHAPIYVEERKHDTLIVHRTMLDEPF